MHIFEIFLNQFQAPYSLKYILMINYTLWKTQKYVTFPMAQTSIRGFDLKEVITDVEHDCSL